MQHRTRQNTGDFLFDHGIGLFHLFFTDEGTVGSMQIIFE